MAGTPPRVVIVGAGFGGLWAARALAGAPVDILLIDRNNYHTFLPLLYQVAAAELEPEEILYPIRSVLRRLPRARFAMAEVLEIDFPARILKTADRSIPYEFLILAVGSRAHFFNIPGAAEHAFPLKTLEQGIALRNHVLRCFERAVYEGAPDRRRELLTFAIVGGGPTGVEFAGALIELIRGPLRKDYPTLELREVRVILLEALETLLVGLPERLRAYAARRLHQIGVEIRLGSHVSQVTPHSVHLKDATVIPTRTTVWTAGVRGGPLVENRGLEIAHGGRVVVLPTLQLPGHPNVYVIGDLAFVEEGGSPLPMLAPVAIQQGTTAAQNIRRQLAGQSPQPFRYHDRGTMATIGRNAAVATLGGRAFTGFPAWVLWLVVHLATLIGFRNRLVVLLNWALDYFFYERAMRLILPLDDGSGRATAPHPTDRE